MNRQEKKNLKQICQNPVCDNKTNSPHSRFCKKCSLRHYAKQSSMELLEEEIDLGNEVGYILKRKDG